MTSLLVLGVSSEKVPGSDVTLLVKAESAASFTKLRTLCTPAARGPLPDSSQPGSKVAVPISSLPCRERQGEDQLVQAAV